MTIGEGFAGDLVADLATLTDLGDFGSSSREVRTTVVSDLAARKMAEADGRVASILRWLEAWWRLEADFASRSEAAGRELLMISLAEVPK